MFKIISLCLLILVVVIGCGPKEKRISEVGQAIKDYHKRNPPDSTEIPSPDEFIIVDTQPEQIYEHPPEYPRKALESRITGYVIIQAFVASNGRVQKAFIIKCNPCRVGFEQAALDAAYKCRYKAAKCKGVGVGVWIAYRVDFVLR